MLQDRPTMTLSTSNIPNRVRQTNVQLATTVVKQAGLKKKVVAPPSQTQVEDPIAMLKEKMAHFTRLGDRKNVLKAMKESTLFRFITLPPVPSAPKNEAAWKELEQEVCASRFNLNGIALGPGCYASSKLEVKRILKEVCDKLTMGLSSITAEELYQSLILRIAATTTKTDSFTSLNNFVDNQQLVLQTPQVPTELPTPNVTIYESGSDIHLVLDIFHPFGLYRKIDLSGSKPWIKMTAAVHERANLSTGASVRTMEVRLPHK